MNNMNLRSNLGMKLLAVWLILNGAIGLLALSFAGLPLIMTILAFAAGVLILLNK